MPRHSGNRDPLRSRHRSEGSYRAKRTQMLMRDPCCPAPPSAGTCTTRPGPRNMVPSGSRSSTMHGTSPSAIANLSESVRRSVFALGSRVANSAIDRGRVSGLRRGIAKLSGGRAGSPRLSSGDRSDSLEAGDASGVGEVPSVPIIGAFDGSGFSRAVGAVRRRVCRTLRPPAASVCTMEDRSALKGNSSTILELASTGVWPGLIAACRVTSSAACAASTAPNVRARIRRGFSMRRQHQWDSLCGEGHATARGITWARCPGAPPCTGVRR